MSPRWRTGDLSTAWRPRTSRALQRQNYGSYQHRHTQIRRQMTDFQARSKIIQEDRSTTSFLTRPIGIKGYVVDDNGVVWKFVNSGSAAASWTNITGNLSKYTKAIDSIAVMSGANVPGGLELLIGGRGRCLCDLQPRQPALCGRRSARGMPELYVTDVRYEQSSDALRRCYHGATAAQEIPHFLARSVRFTIPASHVRRLPVGSPPLASDLGVLTITTATIRPTRTTLSGWC